MSKEETEDFESLSKRVKQLEDEIKTFKKNEEFRAWIHMTHSAIVGY